MSSQNDLPTLLKQALTKNNLSISDEIQTKLVSYLLLMQHWNQAFNLTAIRDPKDMVWLHIIDSLATHHYLHGERILDVGTGAGLPGIPLALINPNKTFTLLDSNSKKTRFLTQVVLDLRMSNVEVVHARCEKFTPAARFDSIVSRAFSSLSDMLKNTQHLAQPDALFLAMKGVYPEAELAEIASMDHFQVVDVKKVQIEGLDVERHVVRIQKK